jgi:hypothetical protein
VIFPLIYKDTRKEKTRQSSRSWGTMACA